jgi:hypothetical protein
MEAPLTISARAHDIKIDVFDSCNCCCFSWKWRPSPTTPVYVNDEGIAEKLDLIKAKSEREVLRRCVENLLRHIDVVAAESARDSAQLRAAVERRVGVSLSVDSPPGLTIETIRRINNAIRDSVSSQYGSC